MTRTLARFIIVIALAAGPTTLAAGSIHTQDKQAATPNLTGTWNMSVQGHQVGLVLEQDGKKVTGTLMMMGRDLPLEGEFVDGTLTLVGVKEEGDDSAGLTHAGASGPGPITAKLKDDGTLEGELSTNKGRMPWTAERLEKQ